MPSRQSNKKHNTGNPKSKNNFKSSNANRKSKASGSKVTVNKKSVNDASVIKGDAQTVRLNKYIADSGKSSRRKADELIEKGLVKVNGKTVLELGTKINVSDTVTIAGDPVSYRKRDIYILLNKPKNTITTVKDEKGRKTVMDLIKNQERLFPIGRLDRNTTGVLLISNDGDLAHKLTHPSSRVERMYIVGLDKSLKPSDAEQIVKGVELEDGKTAPCHIFIDTKDGRRVEMTMIEGKNHEIKRIFSKFGYEVEKLDRKVFAGISNRGMRRGDYRYLTFKEVQALKKLAKIY